MLYYNTIAIYIIIIDIFKKSDLKENNQCRLNDAMILTTLLVSS
jgi:hypothetical protein